MHSVRTDLCWTFGPLTGSIRLPVIGAINDFADEGKLAAYCGIVVRVEVERDRARRPDHPGCKLGARPWCNVR